VNKESRERGIEKKKKKTTSVACAHIRIIIKSFDVVEKGKSVHKETHATFFFPTNNVSVSACLSS
jgi:hypothetical protein